jgi:fructose-bisphosphate aldolase, class I
MRIPGRSMMTGGSRVSDEELIQKAHTAMEAGCTGLIFGRNMGQRPFDEALAITERVQEMMRDFSA